MIASYQDCHTEEGQQRGFGYVMLRHADETVVHVIRHEERKAIIEGIKQSDNWEKGQRLCTSSVFEPAVHRVHRDNEGEVCKYIGQAISIPYYSKNVQEDDKHDI